MELAKMMKQLFLAIFLIAVSASTTPAQSSPEQAAKNARDRFSEIKNRSFEMERMKREANKRNAGNNSTLRFPEIKEDFEKIQKVNSEVLQPTVLTSPINYAEVLNSALEINRRAVRLKSNLFSAESKRKEDVKNKKQTTAEPQSIEILLNTLDESINSFVHNSIFQDIKPVNSQDSLKAQNDLETVIKISFVIKEKAEKITKGISGK
jgi:hypothetical protein